MTDPGGPGTTARASVYRGSGPDGVPLFAITDDWTAYAPCDETDPLGFDAPTVMKEGFWRFSKDGNDDLPFPMPDLDGLPWPESDPNWPGKQTFLEALDRAEAQASRVAYRGFSSCRICRCPNGSEDLELDRWTWPSGYRHYIANHDIRVSEEFETFVRSR